MLFRMTMTMPNFQLFLTKLGENKVISTTEVMPHLTQVLAWIYSDILEFCHRICTLLHPQQKGELMTSSLKDRASESNVYVQVSNPNGSFSVTWHSSHSRRTSLRPSRNSKCIQNYLGISRTRHRLLRLSNSTTDGKLICRKCMHL